MYIYSSFPNFPPLFLSFCIVSISLSLSFFTRARVRVSSNADD